MRRTLQKVVFLLLALTLLYTSETGVGQARDPGQAPDPGLPALPSESEIVGEKISPAAPPGFGDRQNTTAWSMQWWNGYLYVGTQRSFACWRAATWIARSSLDPEGIYPPNQPDAECPDAIADIPLAGEIWRWAPDTDRWSMVFRSPIDVPIPGQPDRFVARDIGYRGMFLFEDEDGEEALYVTGVTAREMYTDSTSIPPPRILKTSDGLNFEPIPQQPGTFLGDLPLTGLRTGTRYDDRIFLSNGTALGDGILIESANPSEGNDAFRQSTPVGMRIWDAVAFNDALYIGTVSENGFAVVKTKAQGSPPYPLTTIIPNGAYRSNPSISIVSAQEFKGSLYIGTYRPAELYRINPDDTWDLIVGTARTTPEGRKEPLSGMGPGFDWGYNIQIYRMHEYEDQLYLGTLDISRDITQFAFENPILDLLLSWHYGFDLYRTSDGVTMELLTIDGLGDPFQISVRTFATTPFGLFMGTGSYWYGLNIWRHTSSDAHEIRRTRLPLLFGP